MAVDLVSLISQFLTPQLVGGLARTVGVNETVAQKLVAATIPTVLGAFATTAAAPGGAQKIVDAVSNSDPDLLSKLAGAIGSGNVRQISEGANWLGGLLGGSGVASIAGALSQFSGGAPLAAAQAAVGAVAQAAIGAIGQQDPSSWSDPSSIAALFGSQKDAIAAALPPDLAKALSTTGLLAGLGGLGAAAMRAASAAAPPAASAPTAVPPPRPTPPPPPAAARASGFPMWAIIVLIVVVLVAVWWFMTQKEKAEPAKQGLLPPAIEYTIRTTGSLS